MAQRYTRDSATVSLTVGGAVYTGWLQCEVRRSIEALAGVFSAQVALVPGQPVPIQRQDVVELRIGQTPVVQGYVLAAEPYYRKDEIGLRVSGRDRTGDLVRCSAVHQGGQWRRAKLERIAQDLSAPFGVQVVAEVDTGAPIADFRLTHAETVLEALARAARLRGVLVTTGSQGNLLLTRAGLQRFAGAIRRGWNVIEMECLGTDEDRHSEYLVYGQGNHLGDFDAARLIKGRAVDAEMRRYLPLVLNAEGNVTRTDVQTLADHTLRVRRGQSMGFRYLVEGWTFQGVPWPVNQRVAIYDDVAGLHGDEWLIASVRHACDLREGDVTELVVRPIEAYDRAPLQSKVRRRSWAGKGTGTEPRPRAPGDRALGGER